MPRVSYSCLVQSAEHCICSGACIQLPCIDNYAPNLSGRCCLAPQYGEQVYNFREFFEDVLPRLHTGDIVLMSWPCEGQKGTQFSRCMAHTRTSHVATVYRPSDCMEVLKHRDRVFGDSVHPSRPLLFQALSGGECGSRTDTEKGGVELVDAEVFIKDYLDKHSHCRISTAVDPSAIGLHIVSARMLVGVERDAAFYRAFENSLTTFFNTRFEEDVMATNVMLSQIDLCQQCICCRCFLAKEDVSMLFCSELVAAVYRNANLVDQRNNVSEYVPAMFDSTRRLNLKEGVSLTKEHVLLGPGSLAERAAMGYPVLKEPMARHDTSSKAFGPGGFYGVEANKPMTNLFVPVPGQQTMGNSITESLLG